MKNIAELIKSGEATIIDVRTPSEFQGGHVANSKNIPLQELQNHIEELRGINNIVLCCASGARSSYATSLLRQNGINCENGGSWLDVNFFQSKAI